MAYLLKSYSPQSGFKPTKSTDYTNKLNDIISQEISANGRNWYFTAALENEGYVVKPDIENNLEENEHSPEEMEDYGVYGEGFDGAYLDDSMAADEMEMGMGPGLDGDGAKGKLETTLN